MISEGLGSDLVFGEGGNDELGGDGGVDTIRGGPGQDLLCGDGVDPLATDCIDNDDDSTDYLYVEEEGGSAWGGDGDDTIHISVGGFGRGEAGTDTLVALDSDSDYQITLIGGAGGDILQGYDGAITRMWGDDFGLAQEADAFTREVGDLLEDWYYGLDSRTWCP